MDIYELETASGVVVSVGGQLPQNIALRLQETGKAKVLGTDPRDIDKVSQISLVLGFPFECLMGCGTLPSIVSRIVIHLNPVGIW